VNFEPSVSRSRGRPRASESGDTRGRIVRAAREVFRELGYEGTTNMRVAAHANLTRPAINYHFTSKRDLFRAVVDANLAILDEALTVAAVQPTLRDRLRALITAADNDPELRAATGFLTAADLEYRRHPELRTDVSGVASGLRRFLRTSVAAALESGELRTDTDGQALVDALHAVLSGIAFHAGTVREGGRQQAQANAVISLITGEMFLWRAKSDEPARLG
jgi:AcrR family transcriptional regulator